jgi:hypothetical protein
MAGSGTAKKSTETYGLAYQGMLHKINIPNATGE